mgnify:CR=1 FL=1
MKWIIYFPFVLVLLNIGCINNYKDRFTLSPDLKRIDIAIRENSRNRSRCIQYFQYKNNEFLAVSNNISNNVEVYDFGKRELSYEITIRTEGEHSFYRNFGFVLKTPDTLILVTQNPQSIGIANSSGEVIKTISYKTDVEGNRMQMTTPYSIGAQGPILENNLLLLNQFYRADNSNGLFTKELQEDSYLIAEVNMETGECRRKPLKYPEEQIGKNIVGMYVRRVAGWDNSLVYIFSNIDGIYITRNRLNFEKCVLETNYNLSLPDRDKESINDVQAGMRYTISHDEIVDILYDAFRECYYVFVRKRSKDSTNELNIKFLYPDCFILILDKNLKHMGEVFLPDNTYSFKMKFITPEGLYISEDHVNNPSFDENYMRFRLFKLAELN